MEEKVSLEYQKAQDSAEHYNTMIWTLISVGVGLSLTILYIIQSQEQDPLLELVMSFIGLFVLFYFSYLIESANEKKKWKYHICKKIERENNFIGQNIKTENLPISKMRLFGGSSFGMGVFRIIKVLLYVLYLLASVIIIANLWKAGAITSLLVTSFVCIILAFIGSIITEFLYCSVRYNFE